MALPKKYLLTRGEITHFFKREYLRLRTGMFLVYYQKNSCSFPRFVVSVAKSRFAKAVERSRVKRLVAEGLMQMLQSGQILGGYDYLIMPQVPLFQIKAEAVYKDLLTVIIHD